MTENPFVARLKADPLFAVTLAAVVVTTIWAWFVAPESRTADGLQAIALAAFLVALLVGGGLPRQDPLTLVAASVAIVGLLVEAVFLLGGEDPPTAVSLLFFAGVIGLVVAAFRNRPA